MKNLIIVSLVLTLACSTKKEEKKVVAEVTKPAIELVRDDANRKVDVMMDGNLFTSYIYPTDIKKPVLWPVVSPGGNELTRNFPLKNKAGERVDHPHHVGIWFNYGDVNGLDFWNNSEAISPEKADKFGTIYHEKILGVKSGDDSATLSTTSSWKDNSNATLLEEETEFTFSSGENVRIVDRKGTITAVADEVTFTDNKEGMFAIRVTRELELPSDKALKLMDSHGKVTEVESPDNSNVTGDYLSSEGVTGGDVWATRAKWMKLFGKINGEEVAIVIFDHPNNVGFPTYWHARTYGLFSANTLGQKIFSKGEQELNYSMKKGESTTFQYRLAVFSGNPTEDQIEKIYTAFTM
ncbi:MAG: PmoA family protein [Cyclobacteriaceae bacterium]